MAQYEKRDSGLWSVRFQIEGGKRKRLSGFRTKKEAQSAYEEYISTEHEQDTAPIQQLEKVSFDRLVELFLQYEKPRIKETSYYDLQNVLNNRVLPYFSRKTVDEIKPLDIVNWQAKLSERYAYPSVKAAVARMSAIYHYAERYHDITNIMTKVDRPRNLSPKKEMAAWTPEEFGKFWAKIYREESKALFLVLYVCGCRKGEAYALTWDDIDFRAKTIRINKSHSKKLQMNQTTSPKTPSSIRTVPIPDFLCDYLKTYRKWQEKQGSGATFVFGGDRIMPDTNAERDFKNAIRDSGVKEIRIHDLRHSCATYLISQGINIVAVSKRLGHSSVEQTLNTYAHLFDADKEKMLVSLQNLSSVTQK